METAYCYKEEKVNAATHAVGLAFTLVGAAVVVEAAIRHGRAWEISGSVIYAVTLMAAYTASTLSHVFHRPRVRHALRVADQAIIFLFIAGTFTPVAFTWLRDGLWWILHVAIWTVALTGFTYKAVFTHNVRLGTVSSALYLVLGWMPIVVFLAVGAGPSHRLDAVGRRWRIVLHVRHSLFPLRYTRALLSRSMAHDGDRRQRMPLSGNSSLLHRATGMMCRGRGRNRDRSNPVLILEKGE